MPNTDPLASLFGAGQPAASPFQTGGASLQASGAVPGGTPAPDPNAEARQALVMSKEQVALLTQALQQAATPRFGGGQQPVVPGQQQPLPSTPPSYMTQSRSWGPERFMYGVQSAISQLSAAKQERDVRKAENLYTNMATAAQKYMTPDGKFNADAAAKDPFLSSLKDSDWKRMADTLQESWLNPKGTTPHQEGLKAAQDKFKQQQIGRGRLDQFIQGLIHKATGPLRGGPQLTPEQQQRETQEILGKAPIGAPGGNVQDALAISKANLEMAQGLKALKENFAVATDYSADGGVLAYDKSNPHNAFFLRDFASGDKIMPKAPPKAGTPFMVNGVPAGVYDQSGQPVYPWQPNFTPEMGRIFQGAQNATVEKDFLKIPPDIRGQVGAPPNPSDTASYPQGRSDPKYAADLKTYMKQVDKLEEDKASAAGVARAKAFSEYRIMGAVDPTDPSRIIALPAGQIAARGLALPQSAAPQVVRKMMDYMTSGTGGTQVTAFKTALAHADLLGDALDAMNNGDTRALNAIRNRWKTEMGGPEVTNFDVIANAYVREINKMLSAGHVTDSEIASAGATLPDKASPAQIRGALDAYRSLATSKMGMLYDQYQQGIGAGGGAPRPAFPPGTTAPGTPPGGGPSAPPATPAVPKPPKPADPGMKWQYNQTTKQFRQVPVSGQ